MVLADQGFLSGTAFLPMEVGSGVFSLIFSRMNSHSLLWSFLPQGFLQISFQFFPCWDPLNFHVDPLDLFIGFRLLSIFAFLFSGSLPYFWPSSAVAGEQCFLCPLFDIFLPLDWLVFWEPVTGRGILFSCGFQVFSWQKRSTNFVFSPVSCQVSRVGFLPRMALVRRIQL